MDVQRNRSSSAQSKRSLQDKTEPSNQLYVCFLPKEVTQDELREVFGACGDLQRINLRQKQDGFTFCYVHYRTIEDAEKAVNKLNRKKMGDKCINVKFAAPFQKKNDGGGDRKGNGRNQRNNYEGKRNSEYEGKKRFEGRQDKFNDRNNRNFNNRDHEKKPYNKFDRQTDKYTNEKKFPDRKPPSKHTNFEQQQY